MKKLTLIGFLVVAVLACALLYWQHVKRGRFDSDLSEHLAGVWLRQETGMSCTNTVGIDGSFMELSWFSHPDRTNTYRRTGTWFVKDGSLIEIVKTSTNPAKSRPILVMDGLFARMPASLSCVGRMASRQYGKR